MDKEYAKVLEAVAKVDKSFKSSVPSTASGSTGAPAHASARPPPDIQGSIAMRVVRLATRRPDASNGSITEVNHQGKMLLPGITASQLFVYARDAAFFKTVLFSGDRASNLTLLKTQEIMRFP